MLEIVSTSSDKYYLEQTNLFNKEDIIDVSLLLSIGKIKDLKNISERNLCGFAIPNLEQLAKIKDKASSYKNIRIWYSSLDNEDVSVLYFVINYLSNIENIYICDVACRKYYSLSGHSIEDINELLEQTRKLTKEEIESYKNLWNKLEEENSDLRILNNSHLESKDYEYLDNKILELLQGYASIAYHDFIGECIIQKICGFSFDIIFKTRIDEMIKNGKIEICETKQEKNFMNKLVDRKYIRASRNIEF